MAETGKIIALAKAMGITPSQVRQEIAQLLPDEVDDWLESHITNPDSPPLDRSLTSSVSATPADITGDLKSALLNDGAIKKIKIMDISQFYLGAASLSTNQITGSTTRVTCLKLLPTSLKSVSFDSENIKVTLRYYDANGDLVSLNYQWITTSPVTLDSSYPFFRLVVAKVGDATITDVDNTVSSIETTDYIAGQVICKDIQKSGYNAAVTSTKFPNGMTSTTTQALILHEISVDNSYRLSVDPAYTMSVRYIDTDGGIAKYTDWVGNSVSLGDFDSADYKSIAVIFKRTDGTNLSSTDLDKILNTFHCENFDKIAYINYPLSETGTVENPSTTTYSRTDYIPCKTGDSFVLDAVCYGASCIFLFDAEQNIIGQYFNNNVSGTNRRTRAEFSVSLPDAKYIVCQSVNSSHWGYISGSGIFRKIMRGENYVLYKNYTIHCAKETTYNDGTDPKVEWYLVENIYNATFYRTKDFVVFDELFTWENAEPSYFYSFGITQNDDILAIYKVEAIADVTTHDDGVRKNPYVWVYNESYKIRHEINFGSGVKPSGWLENVGYKCLPDGTVVFCEYTRPSVETCNCWHVNPNNILNKTSWQITKSFTLSGTSEGMKHCHCVMHDQYTGIVYLTTGDDDVGSQVWHSTDNGLTWTQTTTPSEKYCRMLNYIFTEDYVYWASDTSKAAYHWVFKAPRNDNGVIDYANVQDVVQIPQVDNVATYGLSYLKSLGICVLMDKVDGGSTYMSMAVRAFNLESEELTTIGNVYSASSDPLHLGFRTIYTEWYPEDNKIKMGFGNKLALSAPVNYNKGFGNNACNDCYCNVNNLEMAIGADANGHLNMRLNKIA